MNIIKETNQTEYISLITEYATTNSVEIKSQKVATDSLKLWCL